MHKIDFNNDSNYTVGPGWAKFGGKQDNGPDWMMWCDVERPKEMMQMGEIIIFSKPYSLHTNSSV